MQIILLCITFPSTLSVQLHHLLAATHHFANDNATLFVSIPSLHHPSRKYGTPRYPRTGASYKAQTSSHQSTSSSVDRTEVTYEANDCIVVCPTKNPKNPLPIGGGGNREPIAALNAAKPRRDQYAHNHGRNAFLGVLHLAAMYPPAAT
jgi:hypothetical protein